MLRLSLKFKTAFYLMPKKKKIVVIGGGTGSYTVLSGLKKYPVELSAVISMTDDGGSTGVLREEFGVLPAGDIRRALVALSQYPNADAFLAKLFTYRFEEGGIRGHSFGNLMLLALERVTGSFEKAVRMAERLLAVPEGCVIPVTLTNARLCALLENGTMVRGESNIDIPKHNGALRISRAWLAPRARANPRAVRAVLQADLIVIGPGDLYTSIVPNLLVKGVREAIMNSRARKVYVMNLMTKFGETYKFTPQDFLHVLEQYLAPGVFDTVLVNTKRPSEQLLRRYRKEKAFYVNAAHAFTNTNVVKAALLRRGDFIRHDSDKLAHVIMKLI